MEDIKKRLEALEKTSAYHTKLLEDIFDAVDAKTVSGQEKKEQVRQQMEQLRSVMSNATGGSKQVLDIFDSMIASVVPK